MQKRICLGGIRILSQKGPQLKETLLCEAGSRFFPLLMVASPVKGIKYFGSKCSSSEMYSFNLNFAPYKYS